MDYSGETDPWNSNRWDYWLSFNDVKKDLINVLYPNKIPFKDLYRMLGNEYLE